MKAKIKKHLAKHDFYALFIEELGWDIADDNLQIEVENNYYNLNLITHKRGNQVFRCRLNAEEITNRQLLRSIEKELSKHAYHHIAIYDCVPARQQCWQWASVNKSGHRLRHREHPFTSHYPPDNILTRISSLAVSFTDEDRVTTTDISGRVSKSFDNKAEFSSFFRGAEFRRLSDHLHQTWRETQSDEDLNKFLMAHLPLLKWASNKFIHKGLDQEDAYQEGFFALRSAAIRFDPDHGAQFSTYASKSIERIIQRKASKHTQLINRSSSNFKVFWACKRRANRLSAQSGFARADHFMDVIVQRKTGLPKSRFQSVAQIPSLDDPKFIHRKLIQKIPSTDLSPIDALDERDQICKMFDSLDELDQREASIIKMRFGLGNDGIAYTLEEVGRDIGISKERVRQVQSRVLKTLRDLMEQPSETEILSKETWHPRRFTDNHTDQVLLKILRKYESVTHQNSSNATGAIIIEPSSEVTPESSDIATIAGCELSQNSKPNQNEPFTNTCLFDDTEYETDSLRILWALCHANSTGGLLTSELIRKLEIPGPRVRKSLHQLSVNGKAHRMKNLRWSTTTENTQQ